MHDNSYQDTFVPKSNLIAQLTHATAELHCQLAWHAAILYKVFQYRILLIRLDMVSDGL